MMGWFHDVCRTWWALNSLHSIFPRGKDWNPAGIMKSWLDCCQAPPHTSDFQFSCLTQNKGIEAACEDVASGFSPAIQRFLSLFWPHDCYHWWQANCIFSMKAQCVLSTWASNVDENMVLFSEVGLEIKCYSKYFQQSWHVKRAFCCCVFYVSVVWDPDEWSSFVFR